MTQRPLFATGGFMPIRLIISKNGKRLVKETVPEPAYLWLSISLLAQGDLVVIAQQEVSVQAISDRDGTWLVRVLDPITNTKREESYNAHQFLYTKATDAVKARLKQKHE